MDLAGCATVNPECSQIVWGDDLSVAATCGTATLEGDTNFSVLGCYPTVDCDTLGGVIPGTTSDKYVLACDSIGLFVTANVMLAISFAL